MPQRKRPWLFLPFLGGEGRPKKAPNHERAIALGRRASLGGNTEDADNVQLSRQATVQEFAEKTEEDIVRDYNSPTHMWVVATLFPLIAGTFGPMASFFNICAIAVDWRIIVNLNNESQGEYIQDPKWLVAVNIVSLVIAIIANISLLGQMTNRLRYNISGPITIAGFYVSGLVDIALVAAASQNLSLPDNPNATYSQAFYYAAISGGIYFVLAMMLSVTGWGIWFGHYSNEFKLSVSQRSLMLQTILFLTYVLCAGAVYAKIENWTYLDANYFVIVTLFTIGFGDLVPVTHLGRSLYFPFAVGGILFVGVIIANIRTLVLESGSVKVSTRMVEKARTQAIKTGRPEDGILKLRGVKHRDTNADTELERRKKEFHIMREIQVQADHNNRLFALSFATIAFMVLWFIGALVFWKAESLSVGGQNWTYFESLYFTFVAQLTVGYGDFEPQSNSAKPAFVFWALIALPTLTVLIGAIGDSVSTFVTWYTDWIGKNTQVLYAILEAMWQPNNRARDKIKALYRGEYKTDDPESDFREIANIDRRSTMPLNINHAALTDAQAELAEETYRPFIILKAAQKVLSQLDHDPPRKYTFEEWTWLLKLLGEDETDEEGHRRVGVPLEPGAEVVTPRRTEKHEVWSWLGQESPLMSLEEDSEPKWVLKRLMAALEEELQKRADRHIERHLGPINEIPLTESKHEDSSSGS